jgi:hypothetical protein
MLWTVAVFDFVTTDPSVESHQRTAVATSYTVNNFSTSASYGQTSSLIEAVHMLLIVIGFVGVVINVFVFVGLSVFKEFHKNPTNVFIHNQTIIDAVASFALATTFLIQKLGQTTTRLDLADVFCVGSSIAGTLFTATSNASTFSLIVITLERYFKIVHPLKHRINFRPWMIKLGVVAPWINGFFVALLPVLLTSDVVDGVCRIAIGNPYAGKPYFAFMFVWRDIVPLVIFIFCYSKICMVIRRQNRIFAVANKSSNVTAGPSSGWTENDLRATNEVSISRATAGANTNEDSGHRQISQAERKVIQTMLMVTACYIICWFPFGIFMIFYGLLPQTVAVTASSVLVVFAYVNLIMNAVIYSFRLGVITRSWQALRRLNGVTTQLP